METPSSPANLTETKHLAPEKSSCCGCDQYKVKELSKLCFVLGFTSIIASIGVWFFRRGDSPESKAHGERFGIFVGLWAPTFMILSNRLDRYAEKKN